MSNANERLKILLVDDNIPSRNVLEEFLEGDDYSIVTAENGLEAIHALKELQFDLVITDLKMPGANGIEVLMMYGLTVFGSRRSIYLQSQLH